MAQQARVIPSDDIDKIGHRGWAILNGLGSLATIAYSGAYLSDLARRRKWEKRVENQLSSGGRKSSVNIPDETPLVILNDQSKTSSLLASIAEARNRL